MMSSKSATASLYRPVCVHIWTVTGKQTTAPPHFMDEDTNTGTGLPWAVWEVNTREAVQGYSPESPLWCSHLQLGPDIPATANVYLTSNGDSGATLGNHT